MWQLACVSPRQKVEIAASPGARGPVSLECAAQQKQETLRARTNSLALPSVFHTPTMAGPTHADVSRRHTQNKKLRMPAVLLSLCGAQIFSQEDQTPAHTLDVNKYCSAMDSRTSTRFCCECQATPGIELRASSCVC